MISKYQFKGQAYICGSRQDKDGCEIVKIKFDASQAVEVAKLKLLGRDLENYLPVLLDLIIKTAPQPNKAKIENRKTPQLYR